jgi:hypothetical protein
MDTSPGHGFSLAALFVPPSHASVGDKLMDTRCRAPDAPGWQDSGPRPTSRPAVSEKYPSLTVQGKVR